MGLKIQKTRNKSFTNLSLHVITDNVIKSHLGCPCWLGDESSLCFAYPHCICYPPLVTNSHLHYELCIILALLLPLAPSFT